MFHLHLLQELFNNIWICFQIIRTYYNICRNKFTVRGPLLILVSSTSIFPCASFTNLVAHGSGTDAPSISFFKNSVSISAFETGTIVTFPPFSTVLNPLFTIYFLNDICLVYSRATSGEANFLPPKSLTEFIPESSLTTNDAPPLAAPDITLMSLPSETTYPLIVGLGPIYVASISLC